MTQVSSLDCRICYLPYDDTKRVPTVVLPCLHTFCQQCVDRVRSHVPSSCPNCRQRIAGQKPNFAFRDSLMELAKQLTKAVKAESQAQPEEQCVDDIQEETASSQSSSADSTAVLITASMSDEQPLIQSYQSFSSETVRTPSPISEILEEIAQEEERVIQLLDQNCLLFKNKTGHTFLQNITYSQFIRITRRNADRTRTTDNLVRAYQALRLLAEDPNCTDSDAQLMKKWLQFHYVKLIGYWMAKNDTWEDSALRSRVANELLFPLGLSLSELRRIREWLVLSQESYCTIL